MEFILFLNFQSILQTSPVIDCPILILLASFEQNLIFFRQHNFVSLNSYRINSLKNPLNRLFAHLSIRVLF